MTWNKPGQATIVHQESVILGDVMGQRSELPRKLSHTGLMDTKKGVLGGPTREKALTRREGAMRRLLGSCCNSATMYTTWSVIERGIYSASRSRSHP